MVKFIHAGKVVVPKLTLFMVAKNRELGGILDSIVLLCDIVKVSKKERVSMRAN